MNEQDEVLRWSPYPRSAYTITTEEGFVAGLGAHPIFGQVAGAWNIFWLTYAQLDSLAYYKGDLSAYVTSCDAVAVCVGAALQVTPPNITEHSCLGDLAEQVRPKQFIEVVAKFPTFLPAVFFSERWFAVAKSRAARYRVVPDNVIVGNFRKV